LVLWCLGTKDVFPDAKFFVETKQSIISTVVQRTLEVQLLEFDNVCQKIYQCWCVPNSKRSLCTKHLKDNITDYLKNKIGINTKDRIHLIDLIFGEQGILNSADTVTRVFPYDTFILIDKRSHIKISQIECSLDSYTGFFRWSNNFVKAKGFSETEQMLHQFKEALPSDASMSHLNIKTPKDNDWFAQGSVF
jgi:hypothetical protein